MISTVGGMMKVLEMGSKGYELQYKKFNDSKG
jgi:hypothetical protein